MKSIIILDDAGEDMWKIYRIMQEFLNRDIIITYEQAKLLLKFYHDANCDVNWEVEDALFDCLLSHVEIVGDGVVE